MKTREFGVPLYPVEGAPIFKRDLAYAETVFDNDRLSLGIDDLQETFRAAYHETNDTIDGPELAANVVGGIATAGSGSAAKNKRKR